MSENEVELSPEEKKIRFFRFKFGKYKGLTFQKVSGKNISYIIWASENLEDGPTKEVVRQFCGLPDVQEQIRKFHVSQTQKKGYR
ncbi:MAG: hypothetical protein JRC86_13010 [Deltaproteobacteria bacterium]|nr:hypothetical protein [Deltaproteobacteria bacterium]